MGLRNFHSIACPSTQLESACLCVTSLLSWTSCGPSLVVSAEPPEPPWLLSLFRGVAALSSPASRLWRQPDYIPGTLCLQPSISVPCPLHPSGLESTEGTGRARVTHKAPVHHLWAAWHAGFTSAVWVSVVFITERDSLQARAEQFNKVFNKLSGRGSRESAETRT